MSAFSHSLPRRLVCFALTLALPALATAANVGALGLVIPAGDVITVPGTGSVAEVHVQVGDEVAAGDALVTLLPAAGTREELDLARLALREAEQVGARNLRAAELRLEIARHDHAFARTRHDRFVEIGGSEVSPQQMEMRTYELENAKLNLEAAENALARGREEVAINTARARTRVALAQQAIDHRVLRAPAALSVVEVAATPGGVVDGGVVMLADRTRMQVRAEVFAGDLAHLKVGQKATITSNALASPITGRVLRISPLVTGRAKVVNVLLSLDDPAAVHNLIHLEVNVSIET